MNILLIESDRMNAEYIKRALKIDKHSVKAAVNGDQGFDLALSGHFNLLIIELKPPKKDSITICSELRRSKIETPILITSEATHEEVIVRLLDAGADDFLARPFGYKLLGATIRAVTRRPSVVAQSELEIGNLTLSPSSRLVHCRGKSLNLRPKEYQLLEYMMRNPDRALSREELLLNVWGVHTNTSSNRLDVHVKYLRQKLEDGQSRMLITTVRNVGYMVRNTLNTSK